MNHEYHTAAQNRPLSARQKRALACLAEKAWPRMACLYEDAATMRREEAVAAAGRRISEARNGDYLLLGSHFLALAGDAKQAFEWHLRWQSEARRVGVFAVEEECRRFGYDTKYADRIALDRFGARASDLDVNQAKWLAWTVRNNGLRKQNEKSRS